MKGLLLKDWYMMKSYCKAYLAIAAIFIAISFASSENLFFVFWLNFSGLFRHTSIIKAEGDLSWSNKIPSSCCASATQA